MERLRKRLSKGRESCVKKKKLPSLVVDSNQGDRSTKGKELRLLPQSHRASIGNIFNSHIENAENEDLMFSNFQLF